jgi:hypothetical protein
MQKYLTLFLSVFLKALGWVKASQHPELLPDIKSAPIPLGSKASQGAQQDKIRAVPHAPQCVLMRLSACDRDLSFPVKPRALSKVY